MTEAKPILRQIPLEEIRPLIERDRDPVKKKRIRESIRELGLRVPIEVKALDGDAKFKYSLIAGQGRLEIYRELLAETGDFKYRKIPALVKQVSTAAQVGQFLAENLIRQDIPWHQRAELVRDDLDAGMPAEDVAARHFITRTHLNRLVRLMSNLAPDVRGQFADLKLEDAEGLSRLPVRTQRIVLDVAKARGMEGELRTVIRRAEEAAALGHEPSATDLLKGIEGVEKDLKRLRGAMKPKRLHFSIGPMTLAALLEDRKFRRALDAEGISVERFEKAMAV